MPFDTFDLGRVLQTAEAIKGIRKQSAFDNLREQYMGEQIKTMQGNRERQSRLDEITLGKEKAQHVHTQMQYVLQAQNPKNFVEQNFPDLVTNLQKNGVQWETLTDDGVKQMAKGIMAKAGTEAGIAPAIQLETVQGPNGAILQRNPVTNEMKSVIGREPVGTTVNVNTKQETEEAKAIGKALGQQYADIQKAGVDANNKVSRYQRMTQLLDGVKTGKLTPKITELSALADSLGITLDPNIGEKQALQALSNEIALGLRNPSGGAGMPGALSDSDRQFLVSMTPGLANTPEGNKLIIQSAIKLAKRDQQVAKKAREYRAKHGTIEGFAEELAQWSAENPLFEAESAVSSAAGKADFIYVPGQGLQPSQ